ncbi:MAG: 50S ribosomal protein L11 methyltransferase [Cyanobacteria bacterium J06600_6]
MNYASVWGQQNMTLDARRNQAYYDALKQVITPDSVVLDLGAGLGILGLLAAQLGAKKVYAVDPEATIQVAKDIARQNGYGERFKCLKGKIEKVDLPEKVDVIISVFTGNFLLQEDLLPSLFYARDKYLRPGGVMIPSAARMEAVPVFAPEMYQTNIACWSELHFGIDHSEARKYAGQAIYFTRSELAHAKYLAEPIELLAMDFYKSKSTNCNVEKIYQIDETNLCHGWAGWFAMQLGDKWLSTAPHEPRLHWGSAFLPLDPPLEMQQRTEVKFRLQRPPQGDWSWRVISDAGSQQHSTFFALPLSLKSVQQMSPEYQPKLNKKGEAALYVLSHSDGNSSVQQLSQELSQKYPETFSEFVHAVNFVRGLVGQMAE